MTVDWLDAFSVRGELGRPAAIPPDAPTIEAITATVPTARPSCVTMDTSEFARHRRPAVGEWESLHVYPKD